MNFRTFFFCLVFCGISTNAVSAGFIYRYGQNGEQHSIAGIIGISERSSEFCKQEEYKNLTVCECPTALYAGTIAQLDYEKYGNIAEGFVLEGSSGPTYINLGKKWTKDLSMMERGWIPDLLRRGEKVIVAAERCGAAGRNIIGVEVLSERMFPSLYSGTY